MRKSHLSWIAVSLVLAGVAILTGHPALGTLTGGALILLAGAAAAGAARMRSEGHGEGARGQRVPNNLVTLSAAAIITVYAAGFNRTRAAADAFAAQAARRRAPAPIAATLEPANAPSNAPAKAAQPAVQAPPAVAAVTPPPASRVRAAESKKGRAPDSPLQVRPLQVRSKAPVPAKTPQPVLTASLSTPPALTPGAAPADPNPATPATAAAAAPTTPTGPISPASPAQSLAGAPAAPAPATPKVHYKDGTYYGWGRSAHGDIRASVVIQGGRIVLTGIDRCQTAYSCSWIAALPGQVVSRQNPTIDCVSGASDSSYAFQDAITAALFRAQGG